MVIAVDEEISIRLLRLFNEPKGQELLRNLGVPGELVENLHLLGISSLIDLVGAIKLAKYYELTSDDCILTVFTDSMELNESRIRVQKTGSASIVSGESAGLFRKSRSTYIVVPWFSWLSRKTVPPIKVTRRLTKGSPKPAPSKRLA